MQPTHARWEQIDDNEVQANGDLANGYKKDHQGSEVQSIFAPVKPIYSRNYMIVDTVYESPPASNLGVSGPDGDAYDLGFNGLSSVSDEIKTELPPECLKAFEDALAKELQWKSNWGTESTDAGRRQPAIDKGLIM